MQITLQGSLRHFPAAELLPFLFARQGGGTLDLDADGLRARLFFDGGKLIWAEAGGSGDPMEVAIATFGWNSGTFTAHDTVMLPAGVTPRPMDLAELVAEARRRAEVLEKFPLSTVFHVVSDPAVQQNVSLSGEEFKLLFKIGSGKSLQDLSREMAKPPHQLAEVIGSLESRGLITREKAFDAQADATMMAPRQAAPPMPPPQAAKPKVEPEAPRMQTRPQAEPTPAPVPPPAAAPAPAPASAPAARAASEPIAVTAIEKKLSTSAPIGSLTPEGDSGEVFPLLEEVSTIGRAESNSIPINDGSVSTNHARIVRTGEGFWLEDLGSRNGTFVNSEKVSDKKLLADGDVVRIGRVLLTFNIAQKSAMTDMTQPEMRLS